MVGPARVKAIAHTLFKTPIAKNEIAKNKGKFVDSIFQLNIILKFDRATMGVVREVGSRSNQTIKQLHTLRFHAEGFSIAEFHSLLYKANLAVRVF